MTDLLTNIAKGLEPVNYKAHLGKVLEIMDLHSKGFIKIGNWFWELTEKGRKFVETNSVCRT